LILGGKYHTSLQAACVLGNLEIVTSLLLHDADVNAAGEWDGPHEYYAKILMLSLGGHYGSPLLAACIEGHHEVVTLLLDHGVILSYQGQSTLKWSLGCH
jgi:ankyrin repeat protein